jgi:large repetitive protein
MRAQRFLSRKITFVLAILMITSGLQALVTTPASATNPVGSIQFDGNDSMVYSTGAPGSQNTTIEFWMKQTSTGGIQRIFTTSWSFGPSNVTIRTGGNTCLIAAVANVELSLTAGTNYSCPTENVWHHIALVGLGTTWKLYVDGTLARTSTWPDASKPNITDGDAWIGGWMDRERFSGYVSNFRYVIGTAVYTSNFTPPSPPLAATQSAGGSGVGSISSGTTLLLNTRYNNTLATAQADTSGNARTPYYQNGTPVASSDSPPIPAPSTTTLSASSSTPTYGQTVTLSATIKDGGATATTATGTVNFKNNGTSIDGCATSTITSGVAQCAFLPASASTFSNLTAEYSGSLAYGSSIASAISITVSKANQATLSVENKAFWAHQNLPLSSLTTTGGSGTGALEYTVTSGPCTISSGTLYGNPTGPNGPKVCTLTGTQAADNNYNAITSAEFTATMAFSFNRVGLALPSAATTATYGTPVVITATSFGQIPGTISFRAAGQTITGCTNKSVTASPWTTTCTWTPSAAVATSLTYDWVPSEPDLYDTKTNWTPYRLSTDTLNTTTPVTITVAKISTTNSLALSTATPTYGSVDTITATTSAPGTVAFKSSGTDIPGCESVATTLTSPYTAACPWIPTSVASYSLTAVLTPTETAAYATATATALTPTSVRSPLTITPTPGQTKIFGTLNPTLTYSITSGALVLSDELTGALTYTGSDAGSYAITLGTLTNANNPKYAITLASESFTVTKAIQTAVSLSSLSAAFSPSNKTVSLTGSGGTGTGTYQYALDNSNTTAGCSVTGSTLTYTTAGTCVVAVTRIADTNYQARTDVVSFTIGLASQTITFGSLSAKSYSSETFTVSATSSASLTVVFTSASQSVCTTSGVSGSTITLLSVGTCVINANQIGDANISPASQVSQNFIVNPRAITVTADVKTKVYGATDPALTYTITTGSLVLGDAITGALTRAAGTDVGTYQIQQGALTTANNPKYAITFVAADLTITRATPALVLTYPNSNVAILRPGAVDTPTVTTSSSSGSLTFATAAASSICTVDAATGVISLFGAGSCPVAMSTALTTNYIAFTETTTVTVALLSTSLVGIDPSDLVSMGQPFFAHASVDQAYSFSSGNNGASVAIPAGALDPLVPISIHLLTDSADQRAMIGGTGTSVLSVVVSWVAPNGSVPPTNTGKAISVTLTNSAIKKDAKVYSIIGNQSTLLGTATADGSVTTLITEDPVLMVINPVVTTPGPPTDSSSRGSSYVMSIAVDNSAAISVANDKLAAEKAAAELKAAEEKKLAAEAEAAALKVAAELADAKAKADAELKAAQDKAAAELRIAEELRLAQLKAEEELKLAAEKKATEDAALAAKAAKPAVTLYSVSSSLKLNSYNTAYLQKYVKSLKNGASVTCIGYSYSK